MTNLTALISGASAGIGEACAKKFAAAGFNLVLCARRSALIEKLAINLESEHDVSVETFELDVRDANAVKSTLSNIAPNIDVLINNAGLSRGLAPLQEGLLTDWDEYKSIDPNEVLKRTSDPNLIDTRNVLDVKEWKNLGFAYQGTGR